ncbi:hypothetical protein F2Q69_00006953 [Brassica cretica]|uniref:Uncharacterized protein n=1 Tax=Brassica cretica TaxID=69181 RepID=A0A8S9PLJ6_BRACR|nr:hypothetical protein F2Q69_00006953 [Brassica cretica]
MIFRNEFLFPASFASRFLVSSGFQGWNLSSDDIGFISLSGDPELGSWLLSSSRAACGFYMKPLSDLEGAGMGENPNARLTLLSRPTTRSGSRVIRAGFAKAVQELLAQEQTGFKQLLIQELADLKLEDTSEPLEVPDSSHSSQFSSIDQNEAGLTISTFILNSSNQLASGSEI